MTPTETATISPEAQDDLRERIRHLEEQLDESRGILRALREGEVDAVVSSDTGGDQVYTLRGADAAYRAMVEGMAEGALTVTVGEGLILFSNEQFATIIHTPLEQVIGWYLKDFIAPEDASVVSAMFRGNSRWRAEVRLKAGDSELAPVYLSAEPLVIDGVGCICVIVTDLSEQKRNEEIVAAERLARSILEQAAEAIVVVDPGGRVIRASAAAERLAGCRVAQRKFEEVFRIGFGSGTDYPFREILAAAMHCQAIKNVGGTALTADGRTIRLLLSAAALWGPDSRLLGFVLILTDVTEREKAAERAALAEDRFRRLLEASPVGIVETTWDGQVRKANDAFYRIVGWDRESFARAELDLRKITPNDWIETTDQNIRSARETRRSVQYEKEYLRRDGSRVPVLVVLSVIEAVQDDIICFVLDLAEQKEGEMRLLESERSLRSMADAMPQIVWTARPDGHVDYYNRGWFDFTGLPEDLTGDMSWKPVLHPDDASVVTEGWYASIGSGRLYAQEFRFRDRRTGSYRWFLGRAVPLRDGLGRVTKWVGTCTDIDDYKRLSQQLERRVEERTIELRQTLNEKTTLLQEVHHRVKNNLQVVCSLLSMQISSLTGDSSGLPLMDAHARVLAMSLIHEQIYQSETLSDVDFGQYIQLLADRLFGAYCVDPARIQLHLSIERIHITVEQAIPCGLILNELLSNSLKHAFSDGRQGMVRISLEKTEGDRVELRLADNGIGLPAGFRLEDTRSLGLEVVRTLIRQLGADLTINGEGGAAFRLNWKLPRAASIVAGTATEAR
jgi:PAS domain S-box-containing protein